MTDCICAPTIDAEMADWEALGGGNDGCCGNILHTYGFHLPAANLPASDYSLTRDPGRPVNWAWACAGDYYHGRNPDLLARHSTVLTRLMRGELPMICEFIGQPFPGQPVLYWARWDGITRLQRYTGQGHDTWSHISLYRSRADQRPYLWRTPTSPAAPGGHPVVQPVVYRPPTPGGLAVDGRLGPATIRRWQQVMGTPADGVISAPRSSLVAAVQRHLNAVAGAGLAADGAGIAQDGRRYLTVTALQRYLGTPADGTLTAPQSMAVQELQRRLNAGRF